MNSLTSIKRYFTFFYQSKKMNIYLSLFCVILFGILGILPLSYNIYKKVIEVNKLNGYITQSQEKIDFLNDANNQLATVQPSLRYFSNYMPTQSNISQYLVSIDSKFTYNGFFTERVTTNFDDENKSIEIIATIYGYGDMPALIKEIEDLSRVSQINSINLTTVKGRATTDLSITIFYQ